MLPSINKGYRGSDEEPARYTLRASKWARRDSLFSLRLGLRRVIKRSQHVSRDGCILDQSTVNGLKPQFVTGSSMALVRYSHPSEFFAGTKACQAEHRAAIDCDTISRIWVWCHFMRLTSTIVFHEVGDPTGSSVQI